MTDQGIGIAPISEVSSQYQDGMTDCVVGYSGDEYDRTLCKNKIVLSDLANIQNGRWHITGSNIFAKETCANGLYYLFNQRIYSSKDWTIHFKCYFNQLGSDQNGIIFTNYMNFSTEFPTYPPSYYFYASKPVVTISVENNNLCFHMYQNFDVSDSANNIEMFDVLSVPIVFGEESTVDICLYSQNQNIKMTAFGYSAWASRTASYNTGVGGFVTFGGSNGCAFGTATINVDFYMWNFCINRTLSKQYIDCYPLWYPDTIFLLSCDMLPPLDNGISASIITGTSPILDASNQLFDYPTYSFTGSQYCQADNVYICYDKRKTYRVDFWFKATQTTSKAVIFYVNSGATAHSMECFIYNNLLCFAGAGTTVMSTAFTDTASWHCASIYCLGTDSNGRASNLSMYLDGSLVANAGDILPAFESFTVGNFYIGKDDSGNYFKGNLSNLRIEAPENGTPYSDSDFAVPTKAYEPTDYF